mmetsp:Transcript_40166/g.79151  ORF Transcript_40166/g.79151 Transcript_40166/m.79151 type:complete len:223 (+) Transcript_40166:309-977(+)
MCSFFSFGPPDRALLSVPKSESPKKKQRKAILVKPTAHRHEEENDGPASARCRRESVKNAEGQRAEGCLGGFRSSHRLLFGQNILSDFPFYFVFFLVSGLSSCSTRTLWKEDNEMIALNLTATCTLWGGWGWWERGVPMSSLSVSRSFNQYGFCSSFSFSFLLPPRLFLYLYHGWWWWCRSFVYSFFLHKSVEPQTELRLFEQRERRRKKQSVLHSNRFIGA